MLNVFAIMAIFTTLISFPVPLYFVYKWVVVKEKEDKKLWGLRLLGYGLMWVVFTLIISVHVDSRRRTCDGACGVGTHCNVESGRCESDN